MVVEVEEGLETKNSHASALCFHDLLLKIYFIKLETVRHLLLVDTLDIFQLIEVTKRFTLFLEKTSDFVKMFSFMVSLKNLIGEQVK